MDTEDNADSRNVRESASKKQGDSASNPDRLSNLPQELRVHILSCLPIEDAVRTCLLSTKWKRLWTNLDRLVFGYKYNRCHGERFLSFVDRVLMQCTCPRIKEFEFHCEYLRCRDVADQLLDKWLQLLLDRNVELLTLVFEVPDFICGYTPPESLYQNSSLISLWLSCVTIIIPRQTVSWTSLKSLSLSWVEIDDEEMQKILLGCPLLEDLVLDSVETINKLDIASPNVRKLKIVPQNYSGITINVVEVVAPWLQELEISETCYGVAVQLLDLCSLVRANVSYEYATNAFTGEDSDDVLTDSAIELLKRICHVEELILGHVLIQASASLELFGDPSGEPSPMFKCRHLTVRLHILNYAIHGITHVLKNSPELEALVIKLEDYYCWDPEEAGVREELFKVSDFKEGMHWASWPHLKYVEFVDQRRWDDSEDLYQLVVELARFIVRNACVLEKLVVSSHRRRAPRYVSSLAFEILRLCAEGKESGKWELKKKDKFNFEILLSN